MNMSKEFWDEVERVKPPVRERMSGSIAPVLIGGALVDESGYVTARVYWVFPPEMVRDYQTIQFGAPLPVTRVSCPLAEENV